MEAGAFHPDILERHPEGGGSLFGIRVQAEIPNEFTYYAIFGCELSSGLRDWLYADLFAPGGCTGHLVATPGDTGGRLPPTSAIEPLAKCVSVLADLYDPATSLPRPNWAFLLLNEDAWGGLQGGLSLRKMLYANGLTRFLDWSVSAFNVGRGFCADRHDRAAFEIACRSADVVQQKYRVLEYYRALERLYLSDTLATLNDSFFKEPTSALAKAVNAMSTESEALYDVLQKRGLLDSAERIADAVDALNVNRFAHALRKSFSDKSKLKDRRKAGKGAQYIYSTRCAIVHAGARDIIIDEYPDYGEVLDAIERELGLAAFRAVHLTS